MECFIMFFTERLGVLCQLFFPIGQGATCIKTMFIVPCLILSPNTPLQIYFAYCQEPKKQIHVPQPIALSIYIILYVDCNLYCYLYFKGYPCHMIYL